MMMIGGVVMGGEEEETRDERDPRAVGHARVRMNDGGRVRDKWTNHDSRISSSSSSSSRGRRRRRRRQRRRKRRRDACCCSQLGKEKKDEKATARGTVDVDRGIRGNDVDSEKYRRRRRRRFDVFRSTTTVFNETDKLRRIEEALEFSRSVDLSSRRRRLENLWRLTVGVVVMVVLDEAIGVTDEVADGLWCSRMTGTCWMR